MKKYLVTLFSVLFVLAMAGVASAVTLLDYSTIATALSSEITGAIPEFVAIIGLVIGVPLALRLVKRIIR